jgi:STE24 endopeptidase
VPALVGLVVAGGILIVLVAVLTPWRPFTAGAGGHSVPHWQGDFTAAERTREQAYHRAIRPAVYGGLVAGLLAAGVLGLTTAGARTVAAAGRLLGGGWAATAVLGGLAIALILRLVALPFDLQAERVLRRYGLSTQDWTSWTSDQLRGLALGVPVLAIGLVVGYWMLRRWPTTWFAWAGAGAAVVTLALSFVYPVVVEPVFNRFTSMPASALRSDLLALAKRDGVQADDVLIADASRRTTAENAYVSGFGGTRRIVVYDTLVRASPDEVRLVVAHELGHAKRNDVLHNTLIAAVSTAAGVCLLFLLLTWKSLLDRAGVARVADPRSVALVLFLIAAMGQLAQPGFNLMSRRIEARADVHALELTHDPATFARVERRLALSNLSDLHPSPLLYGLFATHPSTVERIALARDWARRDGLPEPGPLAPG